MANGSVQILPSRYMQAILVHLLDTKLNSRNLEIGQTGKDPSRESKIITAIPESDGHDPRI